MAMAIGPIPPKSVADRTGRKTHDPAATTDADHRRRHRKAAQTGSCLARLRALPSAERD
jgi:hypothetical protein